MLFLIYLSLTVAISSRPLHHRLSPEKLFKDPAAFVASFSEADKETIQNLINMVAELLQYGIEDEEKAKKLHDTAETSFQSATQAMDQASTLDLNAGADLEIKTGEAARLTALEATHNAALIAATKSRDEAQEAATDAATFLTKTTTRVAKEKKDCQDILYLLDELEPVAFLDSARKLLSLQLVDADDEQIEKIRRKINEMIAAGDQELTSAGDKDTEAKSNLASAKQNYDTALQLHTNTARDLLTANSAKSAAETVKQRTADTLNTAVTDHATASNVLNQAANFLNVEKARVADEKTTLIKVNELLTKLL